MTRAGYDDLHALDPVEFEKLVGKIFESLGFDVSTTKRSGDKGIDLELRNGEQRSIAQCKRFKGTVGEPQLRDFFGVMQHEKVRQGYFVTSGTFSLAAQTWAQGKGIALVDGADLLGALDNAGLELAPAQRTTRPEPKPLVEMIKEMLRNSGKILIEGHPPEGHTYDELAEFLALKFGLARYKRSAHSSFEKVRCHKGAIYVEFDPFERIRGPDGIWFYNEFDGMSRKRQWEAVADLRLKQVVVATVWEKRIPMIVRSQFDETLDAAHIDWGEVAKAVTAYPERWMRRHKMALERRGKKREEEKKREVNM